MAIGIEISRKAEIKSITLFSDGKGRLDFTDPLINRKKIYNFRLDEKAEKIFKELFEKIKSIAIESENNILEEIKMSEFMDAANNER